MCCVCFLGYHGGYDKYTEEWGVEETSNVNFFTVEHNKLFLLLLSLIHYDTELQKWPEEPIYQLTDIFKQIAKQKNVLSVIK